MRSAQCMRCMESACCMLHGMMGSGIQLLRSPTHPHTHHHRPSPPPPHGDQCEKPPDLIAPTWPPSISSGRITPGQGCLPQGSCGTRLWKLGELKSTKGVLYARYTSAQTVLVPHCTPSIHIYSTSRPEYLPDGSAACGSVWQSTPLLLCAELVLRHSPHYCSARLVVS